MIGAAALLVTRLPAFSDRLARQKRFVPQFAARFVPAEHTATMLTVSAHIVIARPPGVVFALAGDYRNDPLWRRAVRSVSDGGLPRVGTQVRVETVHLGGLRAQSLAEILAFEPGRRVSFRMLSGPLSCEGRRLVEPAAQGTCLRYELRLLPSGARAWLHPLFAALIRVQMAIDLRRLRRMLEAPAALPPRSLLGSS